jgi:hypothetical protein
LASFRDVRQREYSLIRPPRAIEWRTNGEDTIRERFIRAQAEGDLPADADPAILARYIVTFAYGISVQAATGVPREALSQIVRTALVGWPTDLARLHAMPPLLQGPGKKERRSPIAFERSLQRRHIIRCRTWDAHAIQMPRSLGKHHCE